MIKNKIQKEKGIFFISPEQERSLNLAASDLVKTLKNNIAYKKNKIIYVRKNQNFISKEIKKINFINLENSQMISIATGLIPFLEHNDANRALMGSNMQRQAVAIQTPENPRIQVGSEREICKLSNSIRTSGYTGLTNFISIKKIIIVQKLQKNNKKHTACLNKKHQRYIYNKENREKTFYKYMVQPLASNKKSNQNTLLKQAPLVILNDFVKKGQIIADGTSTKNGRISLGKTLLIGYMGWQGYNFEDAIVISKKLIDENIFTSYHVKKYKTFILNSKNEEVRIEN